MSVMEGQDPIVDSLFGKIGGVLGRHGDPSDPTNREFMKALEARSNWAEKLGDLRVKLARGEDVDPAELKRVEEGYNAWSDEVEDLVRRRNEEFSRSFTMEQARPLDEPADPFHASGSPLRGQLEFPGIRARAFEDQSFQREGYASDDIVGVVKELLFENARLRSDVRAMRMDLSSFREYIAKEVNNAVLSVRSESTDAVGTG